VWVTGLKSKYWNDPFIKSEVNVVISQLAFAFSLSLITFFLFSYYRDIELKMFSLIVFSLSILFIFVISLTTLRPVKNSLNSQKRFMADIAHELRTPLAVLKTNGEVFLMETNLDKKVKKMIESNIEELDRMSEIINNLLSFNNLVRPERAKFRNIDMGPIIDSALSKHRALAEKKQLEITVKKVSPHRVWGNGAALEQIVGNLLKNAITYTSNSGHITIRVGPDYVGNVILHIEDNGMGINKNDLLHVFEPFYRAERSRKRTFGSSGLGLTIVSELVKMHSGRITVKSEENVGTVAIVTLPYNKNMDEEESVDLSKLNEISVNYLHKKASK
jgi:two-component system, OmpR family, sensor histidine kinase BaeS